MGIYPGFGGICVRGRIDIKMSRENFDSGISFLDTLYPPLREQKD